MSTEYSSVISTIALIVSVGSFGVAAYNAFRDRPRLRVTTKFYEFSEWGPARMDVVVVNMGRRPVILRLLGGHTSSDSYGGTLLESAKGGLRLGEHERHEFRIERDDAILPGPDGPETYERMWIEDSLGDRHPIPQSQEHIPKLFS